MSGIRDLKECLQIAHDARDTIIGGKMQETSNQPETENSLASARKLLEVCIKKIDIFMFENKIEQKNEVKNGANSAS